MLWCMHVRTLLAVLETNTDMLVQVQATLLSIQLPAHAPEEVEEDGPSTWASVIHVKDPDGVPSPWLGSAPALALQPIGSEPTQERSLSACLSLLLTFCLSTK